MCNDPIQLLLAGFGGQGILFAGKAAAYAGMAEEKNVTWLPSYGPEMRGGTANCSVCVSKAAPDCVRAKSLGGNEPAVLPRVCGKGGSRRGCGDELLFNQGGLPSSGCDGLRHPCHRACGAKRPAGTCQHHYAGLRRPGYRRVWLGVSASGAGALRAFVQTAAFKAQPSRGPNWMDV